MTREMPTRLGRFWEEALSYAMHVHGDQVRKGSDVPYVSHLLSVASLVLEDGGDEVEAIAALLHDAVEDAGGQGRLDDIEYRFGIRVATIVKGCSEWVRQSGDSEADKPSWCSRKRTYIDHLRREADPSIVRVALADKVHNARAIVADLRTAGPGMTASFNASSSDIVWYYRQLLAALPESASPKMRGELEAAVGEMVRLIGDVGRRAVVIGVDSAPIGWVVVALSEDCEARVAAFRSFAEVLRAFPEADIVAVDIPVGLAASGRRAPDAAARAFLGSRGSSVFETPPRSVLEQPTYEAALARFQADEDRGLSKQSYALRDKIFEVDACLTGDGRIREVHPEVSFRAMSNLPLAAKKSPAGFAERTKLLQKGGVWVPPKAFDLPGVGFDDVLDAGAAAWSARRMANGTALSLPDVPETDETGRPVAIWY